MTERLQSEIAAFIADYLGVEAPTDVNYVDAGCLDSMALMNLVVALEERFDVELTDDEIVSDAFRTLGGLVSIVAHAAARAKRAALA